MVYQLDSIQLQGGFSLLMKFEISLYTPLQHQIYIKFSFYFNFLFIIC